MSGASALHDFSKWLAWAHSMVVSGDPSELGKASHKANPGARKGEVASTLI